MKDCFIPGDGGGGRGGGERERDSLPLHCTPVARLALVGRHLHQMGFPQRALRFPRVCIPRIIDWTFGGDPDLQVSANRGDLLIAPTIKNRWTYCFHLVFYVLCFFCICCLQGNWTLQRTFLMTYVGHQKAQNEHGDVFRVLRTLLFHFFKGKTCFMEHHNPQKRRFRLFFTM